MYWWNWKSFHLSAWPAWRDKKEFYMINDSYLSTTKSIKKHEENASVFFPVQEQQIYCENISQLFSSNILHKPGTELISFITM